MHVRVDVYMYLIFVMTGKNISNDGDKGVQICISQMFIEPCVNQGIKVWLCINAGCTLATLTGEAHLFRYWWARWKENGSIVDRHTDLKQNCMYQNEGKTLCTNY